MTLGVDLSEDIQFTLPHDFSEGAQFRCSFGAWRVLGFTCRCVDDFDIVQAKRIALINKGFEFMFLSSLVPQM